MNILEKLRLYSWNLRRNLWKSFRLQYKLKTGLNIKIESRAEWSIYNEIFVDGQYDKPIKKAIELKQNFQTPINVLDLGANVGYLSWRVADLFLQSEKSKYCKLSIKAIEGVPLIYNQLKQRLNSEPLLIDKMNIFNGLVGKREGNSDIFFSNFHISNSIHTPHPSSKPTSINVPFIDINTLYQEKDFIDLLKVDIEGSELMFIENYLNILSRVNLAVFEFHHNLCDTQKCLNYLNKLDFKNREKLDENLESGISTEMFLK